MLLLLAIFVGVFWLTAMLGRVWCGYACPPDGLHGVPVSTDRAMDRGGRSGRLKLDKHGGFP
ncbi:MAG: 4Fe-4S binding protein [Polyangiaceae bacterium]